MAIWNAKDLIDELSEFDGCPLNLCILQYMATSEFMLLSQLNDFNFDEWRTNIIFNLSYLKTQKFLYTIKIPKRTRLMLRLELHIEDFNNTKKRILIVNLIDIGIENPAALYSIRYYNNEIDEIKNNISDLTEKAQKIKKCPKCFGLLEQKDTKNEGEKYWECDRIQCNHREGNLTPLNSPFRIEPMNDNDTVCSKCGAKMELREAKRGKNKGKKFWGCTAFPACKSTKVYNPEIKTKGWEAVDTLNY
jgi:ssDNA-binding Zn-finger/Zn-ribbon topoisomerase 1